MNVTATAYFDAQENYNNLGLRYRWPSPYDLSEEERQVWYGQEDERRSAIPPLFTHSPALDPNKEDNEG